MDWELLFRPGRCSQQRQFGFPAAPSCPIIQLVVEQNCLVVMYTTGRHSVAYLSTFNWTAAALLDQRRRLKEAAPLIGIAKETNKTKHVGHLWADDAISSTFTNKPANYSRPMKHDQILLYSPPPLPNLINNWLQHEPSLATVQLFSLLTVWPLYNNH